MGKSKAIGVCELCGRRDVETTIHHLIPKEMGGTHSEVANLCIACHRQIHALYTNVELSTRLHSLCTLREDEQIKKFLKWIRKQPSEKLVTLKKSNHIRKKTH
ncbi:HNH endonuclease [Bacillus solimangrovi]|uniref:HNH domain-containing protein n=1 Tax=Bacillus solimangrovi TaxID=1305675 RepID=A0A1E5LC55_9BACI|nr:HNH endonuclease [Bacillus solimangrovi]OEH91674.1 hypothetical protein BFG57_04700 [Bacillus solimangrovi]